MPVAMNIGDADSLPRSGGYFVPNALSCEGEVPEDHVPRPLCVRMGILFMVDDGTENHGCT